MSAFDLAGAAHALMIVSSSIGVHQQEMIEKSCKMLEKTAKGAIGTYQFGWTPLGAAAVKKHADTPLLDTGALRESISHNTSGTEGWVGTDSPYAVFQELGTKTIPPRPFMGGAIDATRDEIEGMLHSTVAAVFAKNS